MDLLTIMTQLKDWAGVVGTLLGALVGGAIAWFVSERQFKHQQHLEREKRDLANFETIHKLLSTVSHQTSILGANIIFHIQYGSELKAGGDVLPTEELRMMIDFYAPSLKAEVDQIPKHIEAVVRAVWEVVSTKDRTEAWKAKTILAATTASDDIRKLAEAAKNKLIRLVAPYTHDA